MLVTEPILPVVGPMGGPTLKQVVVSPPATSPDQQPHQETPPAAVISGGKNGLKRVVLQQDASSTSSTASTASNGAASSVNGVRAKDSKTPNGRPSYTPHRCSASMPQQEQPQNNSAGWRAFTNSWGPLSVSRNGTAPRGGPLEGRPPFITVVRRGSFLRPPGGQGVILYTYSSQPRVVHNLGRRRRPEGAASPQDSAGESPQGGPISSNGSSNPHQQANSLALRRSRVITSRGRGGQQQSVSPQDKDAGTASNEDMMGARRRASGYHLMYDRRIVRGNTFSHPMPTQQPRWNPYFGYAKLLSQQNAMTELGLVPSMVSQNMSSGGPGSAGVPESAGGGSRMSDLRRRNLSRRKPRYPFKGMATPPPVEGRRHIDVQTEKYLEELWEKPPEEEVACQTDPFAERPRSPLFVPAKIGLDVVTQIYPGDLFDFDTEVRPILEVLVGKTVEQSLIEVLEEEEEQAMRYQQRRMEERRRAELLEQQRLEEQERRLEEEKERRIQQQAEELVQQQELEERVAADTFAQRLLKDLVPLVVNGLSQDGLLQDPVLQEVENKFQPWVRNEVQNELLKIALSKKIVDEIIKAVADTRREQYVGLETKLREEIDEEDARMKEQEEERMRLEEEERKREQEVEEEESRDVVADIGAPSFGSTKSPAPSQQPSVRMEEPPAGSRGSISKEEEEKIE